MRMKLAFLIIYFHCGCLITAQEVDSLLKVGDQYYFAQEFDSAIKVYNKYLAFEVDSKQIGLVYTRLGNSYYYTNYADQAVKYFELSLALNKDSLSLSAAENYFGLGNVARYGKLNPYEAISYYQKQRNILDQQQETSQKDLFYNSYNQATTFRLFGDFESALGHAFKALEIINQSEGELEVFREYCYNTIGGIYAEKLEFDKAVGYYKKVQENSVVGQNLFNSYNNLGITYLKAKREKKAIECFRNAIRMTNKHDGFDETSSLMNLGRAYKSIPDSAFFFFHKARSLSKSQNGETHQQTKEIEKRIANWYLENNQLDSALHYYNCLIKDIANDSLEPIDEFPSIEQIENPLSFDVFYNKSKLLFKKYLEDGKQIHLLNAMKGYELCTDLTKVFIDNYEQEGALLAMLSEHHLFYEDVLSCVYELYQSSKDEKYKAQALYFIETSKALVLKKAYTASIAAQLFQQSGAAFLELKRLKSDIAHFHKKLEDLKNQQGNEEQLLRLNVKLNEANQQKKKVLKAIKEKHPSYDLANQMTIMSLEESQQFSSSTESSMLNYFYGEEYIYAMALDGDSSHFFRTTITNQFTEQLNSFQEALSTPQYTLEAYQQFSSVAHYLFNQLLSDANHILANNKTLIIMPDGPLSAIPFEAFVVTPTTNQSVIDYRSLDYLINRAIIHYSPSLSLIEKSNKISARDKGLELGVFTYANKNEELKYAAQEVDQIQTTFKGQSIVFKNCSESTFKKESSNANVLHLAVHAEASRKNNYESALRFLPGDKEDGYLYPYEIYGMSFNNQLVVLSACETLNGKLNKGEGIYSISRAFLAAGCPSIIGTFWKSNDQSASDLMQKFYTEMLDGNQIHFSLHQAKRKYLEQGDELTSHPSHWAMYSSIGSISTLVPKSKLSNLYIAIACFVILFVAILFVRKYARQ